MTTSSRPSDLRIDSLKITGYLLNAKSPRGAAKARYFASYGYNVSRPHELASSLFEHFRRSTQIVSFDTPYGTRLVCRGPLVDCPNGKATSDIVSVWDVPIGAAYARLVTAYRA